MSTSLAAIVAWAGLVLAIFGVGYGKILRAFWREPVFRHPVLIVESDDWGPGGEGDARQLEALADILAERRDRDGRSPVCTLGIVLAVPCGERMRTGDQSYVRAMLSDGRFTAVLEAIKRGIGRGVFSPQLHGMEHYWPPAVMAAAARDAEVKRWLWKPVPRSEDLPSPLQSRWADAAELPSKPLSAAAIEVAVREETASFAAIFGAPATVVVPPTFVWSEAVEAAWARAGVRVVVTPGQRYEGRDRAGTVQAAGGRILNGDAGTDRLVYVVRDDYFEPTRGHRAERALDALARKTRLGRPTLLETHRFNFIADPPAADAAIVEFRRMLDLTLDQFPNVRFMSTLELADAITHRNAKVIETSAARRLHVWLLRLGAISRIRKLAWLTGAILLAWLLLLLTASGTPARMAASRQ